MITPDCNGNGVATGGSPVPIPKKTALRDVQNENAATEKLQDTPLHKVGKCNGEAIKVNGTKRPTPERPLISHNGTNENVMNARRRFELELGGGKLYSQIEKNSSFSELMSVAQPQKSTPKKDGVNVHVPVPAAVAVPSKQVNSTTTPAKVDSKVNGDQMRTERFIRLQNFLKQSDEANQREYSKRLLHLPPSVLSKHAVELEKRAIQLTIDEGNEMQRMKALNILAKPSPTNNLLHSSPIPQPSKH